MSASMVVIYFLLTLHTRNSAFGKRRNKFVPEKIFYYIPISEQIEQMKKFKGFNDRSEFIKRLKDKEELFFLKNKIK